MSFLCKWFGIGCPKPPAPPVNPPADGWKPIAVVVYGNNGQPLAGATVKLDGNPHVYPQTNGDGYTIVDVPMSLSASQLYVDAQNYEPFSVHVDLPNHGEDLVVAPTSIPVHENQMFVGSLTGVVPPVDINKWVGTFCLPPGTLPELPYGGVNGSGRVWTPALLCYDDADRTRMCDVLRQRTYTHVPIQLSGRPYGSDYPEIAFDPSRASNIIHEIVAQGFIPTLAFDDARGPDCRYLQPLADLTQDIPLVIMGPYEINDGNRPVADINSILTQKYALWPNAVQAVHFTPGHGAGDSPEWEWWTWAHDVAGIRIHLAQEAWFDDPKMSGTGMEDNARRLVGDIGGTVPPAWTCMQSRPIATVRFEQTTSRVYRGQMTEAEQVAFDTTAKQYCPHTVGFCDGGVPPAKG